MKVLKSFLLIASMTSLVVMFNSCGNKTTKNKKGKEFTSMYICPMHCEGSGAEKPGKCPVCKMDYKMNKDKAGLSEDNHGHKGRDHDGHNHEGHNHDHDGHNHDGHDHDHKH